ncbi:hypothetical protein D3C81_463550 [compost metagenome]
MPHNNGGAYGDCHAEQVNIIRNIERILAGSHRFRAQIRYIHREDELACLIQERFHRCRNADPQYFEHKILREMYIIRPGDPDLHYPVQQPEEDKQTDQPAADRRNCRTFHAQRRQAEMAENKCIVADHMNDVHQKRYSHGLFGKAVGPDSCGQRIDQRLKENGTAHDMQI